MLPVAVLGPVLAPPCLRHRPAAIAGPLQGRPLLHRAPQRGAAFAASSAVCQGSAPGARGSCVGIGVSLCKGSPGCRDGTCDEAGPQKRRQELLLESVFVALM